MLLQTTMKQGGASMPAFDRISPNSAAIALRSNVDSSDSRIILGQGEMTNRNTRCVIAKPQRREHEHYLPCSICHGLLYLIQ